jgi:hypothetical protein
MSEVNKQIRDIKEGGEGLLPSSATAGPINYQVKIKKAEAEAYWDLHDSPDEQDEQDKRGYFIMGHRIRNSTVSYKLLAQGIPELRERLQGQLEDKGFTDVEVIPDDSYPYKWLQEARAK